MRWNLLAVFAVVFGLLLIFEGLDTLTAWRAWFLSISGLVLFLGGIIRIYLGIRRFRALNGSTEDRN